MNTFTYTNNKTGKVIAIIKSISGLLTDADTILMDHLFISIEKSPYIGASFSTDEEKKLLGNNVSMFF